MSISTTFVGSDFLLESAAPQGLGTVRVTFTQDPLSADPAGVHDGLNPAQYSLSGPGVNVVTAVNVVPDNPQSLDLLLSATLVPGTWTLTVSPDLQIPSGRPLQVPLSINFAVTSTVLESVSGGAVSDSAESTLRKHLPSALSGKAWNAIIAGLATGDKTAWDLAASVFDEAYISTATGPWLITRAGDVGFKKPRNLTLTDDQYRALVIRATANKLTQEALLEELEVLYGVDSVRAYVETETTEPFALTDGDTLSLVVDEDTSLEAVIDTRDYARVGQASAEEVSVALTGRFSSLGSSCYAVPFQDPVTGLNKVRIYSPSLGLKSSVRVLAGTAQKGLLFETQVITPPAGTVPATLVWDITVPETGKIQMQISGAVAVDLSLLEVNDYVLVTGAPFLAANRGSFSIESVDVRYVVGVLTQTLVVSGSGTAQAGVAQVQLQDVLFFRPTLKTTHNGDRSVALTQTTPGQLDVVLPATADLPGDGSYLETTEPFLVDPDGLAVTSVESTSTQTLYEGVSYTSLAVADATVFPDTPGWLVIGFGRSTQVAPVRYLGRKSATELLLDYVPIKATNLSGASVILLANRGAPDPAPDGMFCLTGQAQGRVAAVERLSADSASGLELNISIVYPGDKGLGGEGLGSTGSKCSDSVSVWGGDDLDAELAIARGKA